jgi:cobalt-zinc-cadmium efflux system protein
MGSRTSCRAPGSIPRSSLHHQRHDHRLSGDRRALAAALVLVASFAAVEVVIGYTAGSLALLADAGHMLGDAGSLGLALFAAWLGGRPATPERSFGYRRAEILAALANGVALVAIAIWIVVEAVQRLRDPLEPSGGWVLAAGVTGLALNLGAASVLHRRGSHSLNVQGALRHVLADALGSIGVILAGAIVLLTGWRYADPLVAVAIAALVLGSSWTLLRDSVAILLESAPRELEAGQIGRAMIEVDDVQEVHDLHVWTITSGFPALSAHVLVMPDADCHGKRRELEQLLAERFGLTHTTLQVDHAASGSQPVELDAALSPRTTPLR